MSGEIDYDRIERVDESGVLVGPFDGVDAALEWVRRHGLDGRCEVRALREPHRWPLPKVPVRTQSKA